MPLGLWMAFLVALYFTMLCLFTLLRRQWVEKERLTFPLLELPLRLTEEGPQEGAAGSFFRNPLMWAGCLATLLFDFTNTLHAFNPSVPALGGGFYIAIQERPWSALSTSFLYIPWIFGLAYMVPTEILLATWACYFLVRMQAVLGLTVGYEFPAWPGEQCLAVGGYLALLGATVWTARHHLRQALMKAVRGSGSIDDRGECLSYRAAFIGAVLGFAFVVSCAIAMGMRWGAAIVLFGIIVAFGLVYAKLRCEAGTPMVWSCCNVHATW